MHACGHDAHTAALLATAEILASRGLARGSVKLLFQPAEEGGGGAAAAIDDGALEDPAVDAALAFHVWSGLPVGTVAAPDGPVMASVDGFSMRIDGRGAHAATPEEGIDPVPIAAQIVTAAQTAITRRKAARDPAVLSFTAIRAGEAFNVIPSRVDVKGTIRAFAPEVRALVKAELVRIGRGVAEAMGARASFDFFEGLGPTVNDPAVAAAARAIAAEVVGAERIADHPPLMVGEDMGLLLARVPGAMVLLGAADPSGKGAYPHHHPLFDIDERVLPIGVEIATRFAERFVAG